MLGLVLFVDTHECDVRLEQVDLGAFSSQDHIYTDLLYKWTDKGFLREVESPQEICDEYNNYGSTPLCPGYFLHCSATKQLPESVSGVSDLKDWQFSLNFERVAFTNKKEAKEYCESLGEAALMHKDGVYYVTKI